MFWIYLISLLCLFFSSLNTFLSIELLNIPFHALPISNNSDIANTYPRTVKQALSHEGWRKSMQSEFNALLRNKMWVLVPPPSNKKIIGSKWVWRVKEKPYITVDKLKSRVVAQEFD